MEGDIVLGHELVISDVFRVLPPFLPLARVVGGDADVPDGSVKPHVKNLKIISDDVSKQNSSIPIFSITAIL